MSKKSFKGGIATVLGEVSPEKETESPGKRKPDAPKPGETRATFLIAEEQLSKIKAIAYWERLKIKEVVKEALANYIQEYERQQGEVQPIPKR